VRRVSVVGAPGSGKSTVGRRLATSLGVPFVELDSIFHLPSWAELPVEEFRLRVRGAVSGEGWVIDGNYSAVRDIVWERADTVVWLDFSRPIVMRRLIARTMRRAFTREPLWNGNREPLSNFYRWDPQKNIIRWAWVKHAEYGRRYGAAIDDPTYAHIRFIRLTSPDVVEAFLNRSSE
jgi:adenylate kinase family enzyme